MEDCIREGAADPLVMQGTLAGLWRYPVSSLGGQRLKRARVGSTGIEGDRTFGFFDREMGLHIYPARDMRWNAAPQIRARLDDRGTLFLSLDGSDWRGADDDDLMDRVAALLGRPVDLRPYDDDSRPRYRVRPLHLLSRQSLATLQRLLPASAVDERRFRPNLLLDLPDAAGDIPEYALLGREFTVGGLRLFGSEPCARCGFTTLEMADLPTDPAILRTLVQRFERNFGIYCTVVEGGTVALGDRLRADVTAARVDPVVIVGAGQAGAMAARALRQMGYRGALRLYGDERHLPYERPPLSKRIAESRAAAPVPVMDAAAVDALDLDMHLSTAVHSIDPDRRQVEVDDGSLVAYGTLILATGGIARRARGIGRGHGRVHVLRTHEDADGLAAALAPGGRLFVLGGGWIGMEVAAAARMAGAEVTLFARGDRLAPRILPPAVSDMLADLHRSRGVSLELGVEPRFRETASGILCTVNGIDRQADHLVVAIGMVANDGLARRAGIDCDNGIITDADGATSVPGIFAIGDVARQPSGRIESWQNANLQAERAAARILGAPPEAQEGPRFWSEQFGHRLQIVGLPRPDAGLVRSGDGFWDFGDFAVGLDRPERVHRFARSLARQPSEAEPKPGVPPKASGPLVEHRLCAAEDIGEGQLVRIAHPHRGVLCVTRQNGVVHATDDQCPHSVASLSEGFVEGGRIVCPLHFAAFGLEDGRPHHAPKGCGPLAVHPVEERGADLFILLPA